MEDMKSFCKEKEHKTKQKSDLLDTAHYAGKSLISETPDGLEITGDT